MNTFYFIKHPIKFLKLFWRASGRLGLFADFVKQGYSDDVARRMSDELAPPSEEQLKFEKWWDNK